MILGLFFGLGSFICWHFIDYKAESSVDVNSSVLKIQLPRLPIHFASFSWPTLDVLTLFLTTASLLLLLSIQNLELF